MKRHERNGLIAAGVMIAGGLAFYMMRKKAQVTALRFILRGVKVDTSNFLSPKFHLSIGVQNPTAQTIEINSIAGDLNVNNTSIGNVSTFVKTKIAANTETLLPLTVEPSLLSVASSIIQMIRQRQKIGEMKFSFIGTCHADGIAFPLDLNYSLK